MLDVEVSGEGDNLVLLHGMPLPVATLDELRDFLAESYRVVVPNLQGLGVGAEEALEMLESSLLAHGVDRAAVVSHSFGTYRAFQLADSGRIEVTKIVALSPMADVPEEMIQAYGELAGALDAGAVDFGPLAATMVFTEAYLEDNPEVAALAAQWFEDIDDAVISQSLRTECVGPDLRDQLSELDLPVYLRVGARDESTPVVWAEEIAAALPDARLDVVDGVGHMPQIADRDATMAAVSAFLSRSK